MEERGLVKEYQMVFHAGQRDPCTRDVARKTRAATSFCYDLGKSSNTPSACITLSCTENHLVTVL